MVRPRFTFVYLGRRGALARFTLDLARALAGAEEVCASFVIARDNELSDEFDQLKAPPERLALFASGTGAVLEAWRLGAARRTLGRAFAHSRPHVVVELMPHVWSPFFEDLPTRVGARRAALLHDWRAHPGDKTGLATAWLAASALRAERIVTLSRAVSETVAAARPDLRSRLVPLFHPDFTYAAAPSECEAGRPLRVLFAGRLVAYKGLDLFIGAAERAKARGVALDITVLGEGPIGPLRPRLEALGAKIINRWASEGELAEALARCDVVAATYREASQSGVVAAAFGAGRPVLATPVGALPEQVAHERTGLIAARVDADAIADALERFALDRGLLQLSGANVRRESPQRSMLAFARALVQACLD